MKRARLTSESIELAAILAALAPGVTDGLGQEINIERVERQNSTVVVTAYAGHIDSLACARSHIRMVREQHWR